jgi:hypothetical protein
MDTPSTPLPALSVVLVAAGGTSSVVRTMRHLRAQTARARMEVIIVAETVGAVDLSALGADAFAACRVVPMGPITQRGAAAAVGMLTATSAIVGLVEDHSFPEPQWAEAIIEAHAGSWTGVGPTVENANPESAASWVNFILAYGGFAGELEPGEREMIPWHNSAYKRESLAPFADRLGELLEWEGSLQDEMRARGNTLYLEPRARTHHANISRIRSTIGLNVQRGRILGAQRAERERWPRWRRLLQAAGFPLFPLLQLRHMMPAMRRMAIPRELRPRVYLGLGAALSVLAVAEAWGLVSGAGDAVARMEDFELFRSRHLTRRERLAAESSAVEQDTDVGHGAAS